MGSQPGRGRASVAAAAASLQAIADEQLATALEDAVADSIAFGGGWCGGGGGGELGAGVGLGLLAEAGRPATGPAPWLLLTQPR